MESVDRSLAETDEMLLTYLEKRIDALDDRMVSMETSADEIMSTMFSIDVEWLLVFERREFDRIYANFYPSMLNSI